MCVGACGHMHGCVVGFVDQFDQLDIVTHYLGVHSWFGIIIARPFDPSRFLHETQEKSAAEQAVMAFRPQMASLPPPASKDTTVITSDLRNGWHNDAMDFPMISNDYVTIFMLYIYICVCV